MRIKQLLLSALASLSLAGTPNIILSGRGTTDLLDEEYRTAGFGLGHRDCCSAWRRAFNRRLPRNKASQRRAAKARAQRRARRLGQA